MTSSCYVTSKHYDKVAAHRKGSGYEKALENILGDQRGRAAIITLIERANLLLEGMREWRLSSK